MWALFFLISFNYTILRNLKETLLITAPGSGAETTLFAKFYFVFPCAILFTIGYAKLSNILSKKALFYTVISIFLFVFALFAFVLFPHRDVLHPQSTADALQKMLPEGMMGLVAIFRNWTFVLFYIFAELWGGFLLSLMFWGFANEISKVSEAKRFYALFGIGANLALLIAGFLTIFVGNIRRQLPPAVDAWEVSLYILIGTVIVLGFAIMGVYAYINHYVLTDPRFQNNERELNKQQPKLSLKESFFYLIKSPHMGLLALLVISYGMSMNIIEVTWKNELRLQYPMACDYSKFLGYFSAITGLLTIVMILFVGGNVIRRFGWLVASMITPFVLLGTGIIFFALVLFRTELASVISALGTTPLMLAVIVGTLQNMVTKSSKYALFDPTKEMVYIPLDQEQKVKGKAAIDVVAARFGKSGGSLMQQGLLFIFGSMSAITPFLALILIAVNIVWIVAAKALSKRMVLSEPIPTEDFL